MIQGLCSFILVGILFVFGGPQSTQAAVGDSLMHNSANVNIGTKYGNWGVSGAKYGQFTCLTCHEPAAANVKRIKGTITVPDPVTYGNISGSAVSFQNITSFGNDSDNHPTSKRVCEVCHNKTTHHRYNVTPLTAIQKSHGNRTDCATPSCHPHSKGFAAGGCDGCHGNPPTTNNADNSNNTGLVWTPAPTGATNPLSAGGHTKHGTTCTVCHNGNTMPTVGYTIQMGFNFFGVNRAGRFSGYTAVNGYSFVSTQAGTTVSKGVGAAYDNTCSNLYCHGGGDSVNGKPALAGGSNKTPSWVAGATEALCGTCHGVTFANYSSTGSHDRHANITNITCSKCHGGITNNAHVEGEVYWNLSTSWTMIGAAATYDPAGAVGPAKSGTTGAVAPSASFGTCKNFYCHSDGRRVAVQRVYTTVTWGAAAKPCDSCHGNGAAFRTISTGVHVGHVKNATLGVNYRCYLCHASTVSYTDTTVVGGVSHVNSSIQVTYSGVNNRNKKTGYNPTFNSGSYFCSNVYCHSDGRAVLAQRAYTSILWNKSVTIGCDGCHGKDNGLGFPNYSGTAEGQVGANSHPTHVGQSGYACGICHVNTATGYALKSGTTLHTNGTGQTDNDVFIDVAYQSGGTVDYDPATKRCANTICHNAFSPGWGGKTYCNTCHSNQGAGQQAVSLTGKHGRHADYATAGNYNFACENCHTRFSGMSSAQHLNQKINVRFRLGPPYGNWSTVAYGDDPAKSYKYRSMSRNPYNASTIYGHYTAGTTTANDPISGLVYTINGRCTNVWCHSNAAPIGAGGLNNYSSVRWNATLGCKSCHADNTTSGGVRNLSIAHDKHVSPTGYAFKCDKCHAKTMAQDSTSALKNYTGVLYHVNAKKDVNFVSAYANSVYTAASNACTNNYCHSQGRATSGDFTSSALKPYSTARWSGTLPTNCTGCHGGAASVGFKAISSGMHDKHINNTAMLGTNNNYACNTCHSNIVTNVDTTLVSASLNRHVDTIKNYSGVNNGTEASVGKYRPTRNGCYNVNCHTTANPNLVNIGKPYYIPMTSAAYSWKSAPANLCKTCHGQTTGAFVGYTDLYGAPSYANNTTTGIKLKNSHRPHVRNLQATYGTNTNLCIECHRRTVNADAPGKLRNYSTYHLNRDGGNPVRVVFKQGGAYDTVAKSCSSTASGCHGSSVMAWGGAGSCDACHLNVGGADANENYVYSGGGGAKTMIGGTEWSSRGHGLPSASNYASGNVGANMDGGLRCYYCHDGGVGHGVSSNFFRLKNFGYASNAWGPGGVNGVCMICHDGTVTFASRVGVGGVKASDNAVVKAAHYGALHNSNGLRGGGRVCWDCHDPHGDSNSYMIHATVAKRSDPNNTFIPISSVSVTFSTTFAPASITAAELSDATVTGVSTKICNRCHTYGLSGAKNYYTATYSNGHNSGTNCLASCHLHDGPNGTAKEDAFKGFGESAGGSACAGCHGAGSGSNAAPSFFDNNTTNYSMHSKIAWISYRHFMNNDGANNAGGSPVLSGTSYYYNIAASGKPGGKADTARRCLMCHVDHDKFKVTASATSGRAFNLRANAQAPPTNGVNTDMTLCVSCHFASQTRTYNGFNNVSTTPNIPLPGMTYQNATSLVHNSTHAYLVDSQEFADVSLGNTNFKANCLKCHNDSIGKNGEGPKSGLADGGQDGNVPDRSRFGRHISTQNSSLTIFSNPFFQYTSASRAIVGGSNTLQVTGYQWAANQWAGYNLIITGGKGQNQRRSVVSNTADTLTVSPTFTTQPDATTRFDIVQSTAPTDNVCFSCHSKNTASAKYKPYDKYSTLDWYGQKHMKPALTAIAGVFISDSGKTTGGSTTTLIDSTKNWPIDYWKNYKVRVGGSVRTISANTATTLTITKASLVQSGLKYQIFKPAMHPLDTYGRHRANERLTAGVNWNVGDSGFKNFSSTSLTVVQDTTKYWATNQWNGMTIVFPQSNQSGPISANTSNTITFSGITKQPAYGEAYFVGPNAKEGRHVSCADCHNTHASAHNPEGEIEAGDTVTANYITVANCAKPRWATDQWAGYLIKLRSPAGMEQIRFVKAFNPTTGTFTVSLDFSSPLPAVGWTYEILMSDKWTASVQSGGRAGSGSSGVWGTIPTSWRVPTLGNMTTPVAYRKIENVFDNVSSTGLKGSTVAGQRDLCVRCHSSYSYGNKTPTTTTQLNALPATSTDIAKEFNPNNVSHHAVYARGKNQPVKANYGFTNVTSYYNTNWPRYVSATSTHTVAITSGTATLAGGAALPATALPGWSLFLPGNTADAPPAKSYGGTTGGYLEITSISSSTSFTVRDKNGAVPANVAATQYWAITAGLGNTFVPPFGPWSILRCTDCHGSTKTDPVGPHASVNDWMLKSVDTSLQFEWYNGTSVTVITPNTGLAATNVNPFCFNCHRRDVYTDTAMASAPNEVFSRARHWGMWDDCGAGNVGSTDKLSVGWKIQCRHCHGGDKVGGLHGTNTTFTIGNVTGQGRKRFLNGATWVGYGKPASGASQSCYTQGSASNVSSCTQHGTGKAGTSTPANYDYW